MSIWENNVYYHPEVHGLKVVASLEYSSGSYEFDTRVVWRHESGIVVTARDSGCSCPTPFEDYEGLYDLEHLYEPRQFDELIYEAHGACDRHSESTAGDVIRFCDKMRELRREGIRNHLMAVG